MSRWSLGEVNNGRAVALSDGVPTLMIGTPSMFWHHMAVVAIHIAVLTGGEAIPVLQCSSPRR